jgi:hypothetical protein
MGRLLGYGPLAPGYVLAVTPERNAVIHDAGFSVPEPFTCHHIGDPIAEEHVRVRGRRPWVDIRDTPARATITAKRRSPWRR